VPNNVLDLRDSPEDALSAFLADKADAVVVCGRDYHKATKLGKPLAVGQSGDTTGIPYILVARQDVIDKHRDMLKRFIQVWLNGNQDARARTREVAQMLKDYRGEGTVGLGLEELGGVSLAGTKENRNLFGLDYPAGQSPIYDELFTTASGMWMSQGYCTPANPKESRDDSLLREIYQASSSAWASGKLCAPEALVNELEFAKVLFDPPGSYEVRDPYHAQLDRIATVAQAHPSSQVCIEGYTDNTGEDRANQQLSSFRAGEVARYLHDQGVGQDRIRAVGKGQSNNPSNSTKPAQAENRRSTVRVVSEGQE
jgi:outer membrane protein OmpA-like peptidoglycan-associated protein